MSIASSKPTITRKELEGVLDCLINDELDKGAIIRNFEAKISELTGYKYALAVNTLTAAYHLAFRALEISPGDEVVMPSYFDAAPLCALSLTGSVPVLADNDADSYCPGTEQFREKISDKTKAVVAGHMFGFTRDLAPLAELNLPVIEDLSHCLGCPLPEGAAPRQSALCVASFAPAMMITTGNGGIVLTNNSRFYSVMKELRGNSGKTPSLHYDYIMTDFQGAMGISQVNKLPALLQRRREIATVYYNALRITSHRVFYTFSDHFAYQSFPVLFDAPVERVEKYWKKTGIELTRPVTTPLHAYIEQKGMEYPHSDRLSKKLYSLPIYPTLTKREIDKIARSLSNFI
ncbi:MAG TPA: DegT/DnrJ/EryC1/StrS aminotransferase family protein [Spirochaetota bacterium]|nr:DegT/DnrJ/EryC1/StrS aminotransferase family protein [Spirochaetota bacterium]